MTIKKSTPLIIACGALAKEIKFLLRQLQDKHDADKIKVVYLPAIWHNRPEKIVPGIEELLNKYQQDHHPIYIGYADCGTGGQLDKLIAEKKLQRLAGAHCYQFFMGMEEFEDLMEEEIGSFFLTDYLTRHFDELIWQGFGLDKHPELLEMMFGNYKRLVYLAQTDDDSLTAKAKRASEQLGLSFEKRFTGYGLLKEFINEVATHKER